MDTVVNPMFTPDLELTKMRTSHHIFENVLDQCRGIEPLVTAVGFAQKVDEMDIPLLSKESP
jgi:hypothetical protein